MQEKKQSIRNLRFLCIIFSFAVLFGCSKPIPEKSTTVRNGLIYKYGTREPFSGFVVGKERKNSRGPKLSYKKEYKNGRLNGNTKYWFKNGQLESLVPYENGMINGVVTRYYDNGQVKARVHLVDGVRGGNKGEMFWHKNGKRE